MDCTCWRGEDLGGWEWVRRLGFLDDEPRNDLGRISWATGVKIVLESFHFHLGFVLGVKIYSI